MINRSDLYLRSKNLLSFLKEGSLWLGFLVGILAIALGSFFIAREVLQMDFSAFYAAGQSLNSGLSPYQNGIMHEPPIWDGINPYVFSRFQYPPPAAVLFRSIAWLPYLSAKTLWTILSLIAILISLVLTARVFPLSQRWQIALVGLCTVGFFPIYTLVERGQVDALTLLLLVIAVLFLRYGNRRGEWLAGALIGLAILFKLYSVFLLPFLLLRRRWHALVAVAGMGIVLLTGSLLAPGGVDSWREYTGQVLPRIGTHAEDLVQPKVDPQRIDALTSGAGSDATILQGQVYRLRGFNFTTNASLVRVILDEFFADDARVNRSLISLATFLVLFLPFLLLRHRPLDPRQDEPLFWFMAMIVTLLAAPLTWVMNMVWLLPIGVMIVAGMVRKHTRMGWEVLVLMAAGFLLAALPDHKFLGLTGAFDRTFLNHKYVLAELLILAGGLWQLARTRHGSGSRQGLPQDPRPM